MAKTTSSERNKAYRARHKDDPAWRAKERARVSAWRKCVGWRRAQIEHQPVPMRGRREV